MIFEAIVKNSPAILSTALLVVMLFQSGLDKVIDRKGNTEFLTEHFKDTFLGSQVTFMLISVTFLELAAGLISILGIGLLIINGDSTLLFWATILTSITVVILFFGQRIAKDYVGAAMLVPYHILCVILLYLTLPH